MQQKETIEKRMCSSWLIRIKRKTSTHGKG